MKACRSTSQSRQPSGTASAQTQAAQTHVNRYCHPIRTKGPSRHSSTEELLSNILDTLSHQADLLEELLRRTEGADTR